MNDNEIDNYPSESDNMPTEGRYEQMFGNNMEATPPSSDHDDDERPKEGFTFKWFNLFMGLAICFFLFQGSDALAGNWPFFFYLSVVVLIHEMGHVIAGKSFGCVINEMQVFFLPFVSYIPTKEKDSEGNSWRNIKWSLGALPLGGVTIFKSRKSAYEDAVDNWGTGRAEILMSSAASPYIEDKPAWQRMLISAAGVLFNVATFLILYIALPHMSYGWYDLLWPLVSLSLFIAVLNILPVYPLDGGAIVFALYEIVTGKKPSSGFTKACGWIGFIFIVLFFWVFPEWLDGILDKVLGFFF